MSTAPQARDGGRYSLHSGVDDSRGRLGLPRRVRMPRRGQARKPRRGQVLRRTIADAEDARESARPTNGAKSSEPRGRWRRMAPGGTLRGELTVRMPRRGQVRKPRRARLLGRTIADAEDARESARPTNRAKSSEPRGSWRRVAPGAALRGELERVGRAGERGGSGIRIAREGTAEARDHLAQLRLPLGEAGREATREHVEHDRRCSRGAR